MNFILEVLPKKENGNVFVYVVRNGNGYPMAVCESLNAAMDIVSEKVLEYQKANANATK